MGLLTNKARWTYAKVRLRQLFERGFDWIMLVVIILIVLGVFVIFNV